MTEVFVGKYMSVNSQINSYYFYFKSESQSQVIYQFLFSLTFFGRYFKTVALRFKIICINEKYKQKINTYRYVQHHWLFEKCKLKQC